MRATLLTPLLGLSLLLAPAALPGQAAPGDPVYLTWVVHIDPSPYDTNPAIFNKGRFIMDHMSSTFEAHGGKMVIGASWHFIHACLLFGNGPSFPGSLGDLASRGHEIAYHDHGGVGLAAVTQILMSLTAPYTASVYPKHIEGGGDLQTLAALGYESTGGRCGKDIPTQLSAIFQNPVRSLAGTCYGQDPNGPIIALASGSADGSGKASDNIDEMSAAIQYALAVHTPGKLSFISAGASHPDAWLGSTSGQVLADMQVVDGWLQNFVDPLVARGLLVWADTAAKRQLYQAWEAAGGSNADLFPAPNVQAPGWSYLDPSNSPLTTDKIDEVFVDSQDRLWIGGGDNSGVGGLFLKSGSTWTLFDPTNSPLRSYRITSLAEGPPGVLWVLGANDDTPGPLGLALYRYDGLAWTVFDSSNAFLPNESFLYDVAVDAAGVVWVGGKQALYRYDGTSWTHYSQGGGLLPHHTGILCLAPESSSVLWLGLRNGGVVRLDHAQTATAGDDSVTLYNRATTGGVLPADTIYALALHPDGTLYAGTRRGLARLAGSTWMAWQSTSSELAFDEIVDLAIDPAGDVWLASYGGGLSRFRPSLNRFDVLDIPDGSVHGRMLTSVAATSRGTVCAAALETGGVSVYVPPSLTLFSAPRIGSTVGLTLAIPDDGGLPFATAMALGTATGIPLPAPDPRLFPLDNDVLFQTSISGLYPEFGSFFGVLDGAGTARPSFPIPNLPSLQGLSVFCAGVTVDANFPSSLKTIYGPLEILFQ